MMCKVIQWLRKLFAGKKPPKADPKPPAPEKAPKRSSLLKPLGEKDKNAPPFIKNDSSNAEEQIKRATAVASAAAAAAEASVASAQVTTVVVKLSSTKKMTDGGNRQEFAAVKIQAAFRAHLARRALVALKGLVKLQAIVRGNIVRKQTAETLRCMQALIRVQAHACACRANRSEFIHRKLSSEAETDPKTPGEYELVRANAHLLGRSSTLKNNPSSHMMEESFSHPATTFFSTKTTPLDHMKNAKTLEIDPGKSLHSRKSKRKIKYSYSFSPMISDQSESFTTVPDSSSKDSSIAQQFPDAENYTVEDRTQFFSSSSSCMESSIMGPSPAKNDISRSFYIDFSDCPRYMANTESSKAKVVRSQSAPKQRPENVKLGSLRRHSTYRSSFV